MHDFDYLDFDIDDLLEYKEKGGIKISVITPSFREEKTVGKVVAEMAGLANQDLVDEILVVDGSVIDGRVDYRTAKVATRSALKSLEKFDSFKIIHQAQPEICALLETDVIIGKGDALYKGAACAMGDVGDILVFLDSDIMNIDGRFVEGLVGPILTLVDVKFSKAYYHRPRFRMRGKTIFGGRVTRLYMRPILRILDRKYGVLEGLEDITYPLSGEVALTRGIFESLTMPHHFGVEIAMLIELYEKIGLEAFAQVDLREHLHCHRSDKALVHMVEQITQTLFWLVREHFDIDFGAENRRRTIRELYRRYAIGGIKGINDFKRIDAYARSTIRGLRTLHDFKMQYHRPLRELPGYEKRRKKLHKYAAEYTHKIVDMI